MSYVRSIISVFLSAHRDQIRRVSCSARTELPGWRSPASRGITRPTAVEAHRAGSNRCRRPCNYRDAPLPRSFQLPRRSTRSAISIARKMITD